MDFGVVGLDHHHHHHQNHHGLGVSSCFSSEAGFASNNVISSSSPSDPEANKHQRALLYGSEFSSVKQERSSGPSLEEYWRSSKVAKTDGGGSDAVDDDFSSSVCKGMMFQQRNNNNNDNNNNASLLLRSNSNTSNNNNTTTTLSFLDNGSYNNNSHSQQHQMLSFCSTSPTKSEAHSNAATLAYFPNALSAYTATRNTGYNNNNNNNNSNNSSMMMMMSMQGNGGVMMRSGPFTASQRMELQQQALMYKYISANVPIPSHLLIPIRNAIAFRPSTTNPFGGGVWGTAFQLGFANNADPEPGRCRRTDGKKWRCSRDAVADQKYCERHMNRGRHRSRKPVEGPVAAAISNNIPTANTAAVAKPSFELNHSASSTRTFAKGNASAASASASSREFGLVTSVDSLMLNQKPSLSSHHQNSLHQFMDSWPDRTQLSISIPNTPSTTETSLSPLRLSNATATARQAQWIPITWEGSSPGGPLGEVLNKPGSNGNIVCDHHHSKSASSTPSSSVLNLMPEGGACWDASPPLGSSPTGVLQKTAFGSLSNSSAGSSPARAHDRPAAVNIDLLPPPHLGSSSSLPAL